MSVNEVLRVAFSLMSAREPLRIDLRAIRSATVYHIDPNPKDNIGMFAIVEARDGAGQTLGRFVSGLLLGDCK